MTTGLVWPQDHHSLRRLLRPARRRIRGTAGVKRDLEVRGTMDDHTSHEHRTHPWAPTLTNCPNKQVEAAEPNTLEVRGTWSIIPTRETPAGRWGHGLGFMSHVIEKKGVHNTHPSPRIISSMCVCCVVCPAVCRQTAQERGSLSDRCGWRERGPAGAEGRPRGGRAQPQDKPMGEARTRTSATKKHLVIHPSIHPCVCVCVCVSVCPCVNQITPVVGVGEGGAAGASFAPRKDFAFLFYEAK